MAASTLNNFGLSTEDLRLKVEGFAWALEAYETEEIVQAIGQWIKANSTMPVPHEIEKIIQENRALKFPAGLKSGREYPWEKRHRIAKEFSEAAESEWRNSEQGKEALANGWWVKAERYIREVNYSIGLFLDCDNQPPGIPIPSGLHDGLDCEGFAKIPARNVEFMNFCKDYAKQNRKSLKCPDRLVNHWKRLWSGRGKPINELFTGIVQQ